MTASLFRSLPVLNGLQLLLMAVAILAVAWLWNLWSSLRHPDQAVRLRSYGPPRSSLEEPWQRSYDLRALNREVRLEAGAALPGTPEDLERRGPAAPPD